MPGKQARVFSPEVKLAAVQRLVAGEKVKALAEERGVSRQLLYKWWNQYERGGPAALRLPGRPRKAAASVIEGAIQARTTRGRPRRGRPRAVEDHAAAKRIAELETQGRRTSAGDRFFQRSLAAREGTTPGERRAWRRGVFALIHAMMPPQGSLSIERMCALTGVSRRSYYRHWHHTAPRDEETSLRDTLQQLALAQRFYGYRRLTEAVRRQGWAVNHKRVLRLMRTDNLLCLRRRAFVPATTDSRHAWRVVPNLARGLELTGLDQLLVADITYVRLREEFAFLAVVLDAFSRRVIGWAIDDHLQASLALAALGMALAARRRVPTPSSTTPIAAGSTPVPTTPLCSPRTGFSRA
jgi:transposase-like protein